jgi:MSHA pilin protein MshA
MIKMNPKSHAQKGFTLIELIMVIVILGILSAFALPKFADLSGNAQSASIQGALGAVKSGAAIAHAQFLANGSSGTTVTLEGATIDIVNGYPDGADLSDLVDLSGFVLGTGATYTIVSLGNQDGDPCFTYTNATAAVPPATSVTTFTLTNGTPDTCS